MVTNCVVSGNMAFRGGGVHGGALYNCVIADNTAMIGGGAYGSTLYNCTVTGNTDGGVRECTLQNCIVYFKPARGATNYDGRSTLNYCCTTPLPPGLGSIDADPRFVNAAAGDFRLRADSPCIDAQHR